MAEYKLSYTASQIDAKLGKIDGLAAKSELPTKTSELTNDSDFTTKQYVDDAVANIDIPEVDLTDYALKSEIPTDYLKTIPAEYVTESELAAKKYLTSYTETDPTVPAWAKAASKPTYTASEVGAASIEQVESLQEEKANKSGLTLGVHTDGLVYIFVDGTPHGNGLDIKADVVEGDVFGYVDENNVIVLNGALAEGTYTIKYEMDNGDTVEIGDLVLDTNVYHTITNTLTNCTTNNSATKAVQGESYSANITANSGYALTSITVTMGGSAVAVSGGKINIASVTGDIVITAVATVVNYTNLANPASADWLEGYRLSSSGEPRESTDAGVVLTHYIDCLQGDVIRVKGITLGSYRVALYIGSTTKTNYKAANPTFPSSDSVWECEEESTGVYKFTIKYANTSAMRFSGVLVGTSADVIITKNEEIA